MRTTKYTGLEWAKRHAAVRTMEDCRENMNDWRERLGVATRHMKSLDEPKLLSTSNVEQCMDNLKTWVGAVTLHLDGKA